ncbi:PREDICTED: leukocyte elastase inhibitor-like isoform X3 [Dufourea novaeangliae]|uniref:leukocyte elastase inhibitor-like isoform X3 n=1 Tax=Dufourea novaeangliae TaxID=178035 RepID=UPI0007674D31|nr:PREDICTED: leukocyte elastase inhibitor-like isoform X3 [Dufourea novaeangliae]
MRTLKGGVLIVCLISITMASPAAINKEALDAVSQGTNQFSTSLFQAVVEEKPGNLIMSPLSAAIVLAMAGYGSCGETENQFKKVLHIPALETLGLTGYQSLIDTLNNVKENKLLLANKVFASNTVNLKPSYKDLTEKYFRSVTQLVDFAKSTEAANIINTWVSENTNDRIKEIIQSEVLSQDTALVLVNAVYFKGMWKDKFHPEFTKEMPFHINATTVKNVPTMYKQSYFKYAEHPHLNAKSIEIPYQGKELSMVIILPNEIDGLAAVEQKLQSTNMNDIISQGVSCEVQLFLPKFKIESKMDLNGPLQKMGLSEMFSRHANFSGIANAQLVVSKVVQKAFIEVNEEGSEAAAATAIQFVYASAFQFTPAIQIDRPFFYGILHRPQNPEGEGAATILFSGRVSNPSV